MTTPPPLEEIDGPPVPPPDLASIPNVTAVPTFDELHPPEEMTLPPDAPEAPPEVEPFPVVEVNE